MSPMRWLAVAAAAVVILVVGVVAYVATLDLNSYKGQIQSTLTDALGREVRIDGPIGLAWMPAPNLTATDIRIANADWGSEPAMATVGEFDIGVALMPLLSGRVEVRDLRLVDVRVLLERNGDGTPNWQAAGAEPGAGTTGQGIDLPAVDGVAFEKIEVVWKPGDGQPEQVYRIERLLLDGAGSAGTTAVELVADVDGKPLELTGSLPALPAILSGSALQIDLSGSWDGQPLALRTDLQLERTAGGAVRSARSDALTASFGELSASGSGSLDLSGKRPRIDASLKSDSLDLDKLGGGPGSGGDPLDRPLPAAFVPAVDGKVEFQIGRLLAAPWTVSDLAGTASLDGGVLTVDPLSGKLAGGPVAGRVELDSRKQPMRLALSGKASGMDMAEIYLALTDEALIEGQGDASVDLRGTGATPRALLGSTDGVTKLVIRDGVIRNRYWELIAEDVVTRFIPFTGDSDRGKLNCLVSRFDISKGIADATVLMVDSDRVTVGGGGTVNLGRQTLDLKLVPQPKDPSLISLSTPILLTGPISDPTPAPDPVGVAKGIGGLAAGAMIGPLGLLLPFVSGGSADEPCPDAIAAAEGKRRPAASRSREQGDKPGAIKGLFDTLRKPFE